MAVCALPAAAEQRPPNPRPACASALAKRHEFAGIKSKVQLGVATASIEPAFLIEERPTGEEAKAVLAWLAAREECEAAARLWFAQYAPYFQTIEEEGYGRFVSLTQALAAGQATYAGYTRLRTALNAEIERKEIATLVARAGKKAPNGGAATDSSVHHFDFAEFSEGKVSLDCVFRCSFKYGRSRKGLRRLHDSQKWGQLANALAAMPYASDQAYYYLGRAAEGLGYWEAARTYYAKAQSAPKCALLFNVCDGLDIAALTTARTDNLLAAEKAAAEQGRRDPAQLVQKHD